MSRTNLSNRLQKLENPREGTRVVCVALDEHGNEHFLWQVACARPSETLTIRIPPGGDPLFSIEDSGK